jgi:hypothetical protein
MRWRRRLNSDPDSPGQENPSQSTERPSRSRSFCAGRNSAPSKFTERVYTRSKLPLVAEFPRTPKGATDRRALAMQFSADNAPPVSVRRENDVSSPIAPRGGPKPQ